MNTSRNDCRIALATKCKDINELELATADHRKSITEGTTEVRNTCTHKEKCFPRGHIWGTTLRERWVLSVHVFANVANYILLTTFRQR